MATEEQKQDWNKMMYDVPRQERAYEYGLIQVYAYHCNRCNYTWLPKNFDLQRYTEQWGKTDTGFDLLFRQPPKSCARCKSKYWKDIFMVRTSKTARIDENRHIVDQTSMKRFYTLIREGRYVDAARLRPEYAHNIIKLLRKFNKKQKTS
jgi:hypothetical protein